MSSLGRAPSGVGLADLASQMGFTDQAHLSREIRAMCGCTAVELLTRRSRWLRRCACCRGCTGVQHPRRAPVAYSRACMRPAVLFLCTGNYYRSRFAELLFNARAPTPRIRAESRGLQIPSDGCNPGPISAFAREGLLARGVELVEPLRWPLPVTAADLEAAERIIALDQTEHGPMLERDFPAWVTQARFWSVADVRWLQPDVALARIERHVDALLRELHPGDGSTTPPAR